MHNNHIKCKTFAVSIFRQISDRKAVVEKLNCVTTNPASLRMGNREEWPIQMNDHGDIPWVTEIEKVS